MYIHTHTHAHTHVLSRGMYERDCYRVGNFKLCFQCYFHIHVFDLL